MTEEIDGAGDGFEGAGIEEGDEKLLEKKISVSTPYLIQNMITVVFFFHKVAF